MPAFREAFRAYGLPAAVREALLAALDEWVALAETYPRRVQEPHLAWLRAVLAAAEPAG